MAKNGADVSFGVRGLASEEALTSEIVARARGMLLGFAAWLPSAGDAAVGREASERPSLTAADVLRFLGRVSSTGVGRASCCVSGTARVRAGRENVGSK